MTQITREIDGKTYVFQLTEQEIRDVVTANMPADTGMACVALTIIRERACENEKWVDNHRILMPVADVNGIDDKTLADRAVQKLRKNITAALASPEGWDNVLTSSMDFNWGDSVVLLSEEQMGCLPNSNPTNAVRAVLATVNQDEQLMPEAVACTLDVYGLHKGEAIRICSIPSILDMTDGSVCPDDAGIMAEIGSNGLFAAACLAATKQSGTELDRSVFTQYFAIATIGDAGSIPCEPDGGFLCLVTERDFLYECAKGKDALMAAMKRIAVPTRS